MVIVETVLGNLGEPDWRARTADAKVDWLVLDQWEAQKNRFRKATNAGLELAVALERNTHLHDGDVLLWDAVERRAVAARVDLKEVMVIEVDQRQHASSDLLLRTCFELGHALGNQHWPAVVNGSRIFVPLTVDRKVMSSVMRTHAFPGVSHTFLPGAEVIPYLIPHEARRLFGGADPMPHSHRHEL